MSCEDPGYHKGEFPPIDSLNTTHCQADGVPDAESAEHAAEAAKAVISTLTTAVAKAVTKTTSDYPEGWGWGV